MLPDVPRPQLTPNSLFLKSLSSELLRKIMFPECYTFLHSHI